MRREMFPIAVTTTSEGIAIIGGKELDSNEVEITHQVNVSPEQVETLITWLREAKQEFESTSGSD